MAGITKFYPQPREGTGLNRRFERAQEEDFTAHDDFYATAEFIYKPICDEIYGCVGKSHSNRIPGGRLTLTSGTAVTTSDVTAATNIYYTPYMGQAIELWDTTNKNWYNYPFAEITLALGTLTASLPYDVFAYVSTGSITNATSATPIEITSTSHGMATGTLVVISGVKGNAAANGFRKITSTGADTFTIADLDGNGIAFNAAYESGGTFYQVKIEALAWSSAAARATALAAQNGIWTKTGALDRRYLGSFRTVTGSTTTTEDSIKSRLVVNYYNRKRRKLSASDGINTWASSATDFEAWNGGTTIGVGRVEFLSILAEDPVELDFQAWGSHSSAGNPAGIGIGIDSTTVNSAGIVVPMVSAVANMQGVATAMYKGTPTLGYHYAQMLQRPFGATTTYYGDNGGTYLLSAMEGWIDG